MHTCMLSICCNSAIRFNTINIIILMKKFTPIFSIPILLASSVGHSAPTVTGNVISWPDDGWYQVQNAQTYTEVCAGGSSCEVTTGTYIVINHTTGERFTSVVDSSEIPTTPIDNGITVVGNVISWPDDGWYQVQRRNTLQEICAGVRSCSVGPGTFNVINHTTDVRSVVTVEPSDAPTYTGDGSVTVSGGVISWPDDGWYQVQNAATYEEICNGGRSCEAPPGIYKVLNHSTGTRINVEVAPGSESPADSGFGYYADWPVINSAVPKDPAIEAAVGEILAQMTIEEKVGQMIQPDLRNVTPEEASEFKLGSLLNGGGSWPNNYKQSTAADWAATADSYWEALESVYADRGFRIPFMWATDAVHGHNNVFGATVFPHNIGLGAANDPDLIFRIGGVTAKEVAATGLDWTFAPTVAAPRDLRWGRVYEGYSEDPEIIFNYAGRMVEGLQGGAEGLKTDQHVLSNVKHWVGDGGTLKGVDRGENGYSEEYLINLHAMGYFSGLDAGAQVVMSSFNSWSDPLNYDPTDSGEYNGKVHGSKYLITDILKDRMGFDGLVITDWNGHTEVNGCTAADCPQAVLAGNDIFMVPARTDWIPFYNNLVRHVSEGTIPMSRIDDAVTRILRVKMRANLWEKSKPSERSLAGNQANLGADEHKALAREAVRKSLVLLKNNDQVLPLSSTQRVYLAGSAVNNLEKQTGGWTLTWQGTENTAEDFPGATTIREAIVSHIGEDKIVDSLSDADETTVAVVAIGEEAYAEFYGDIKDHQTLGFANLKAAYAADLETIRSLKESGMTVVTIFLSGRPMYVNEEINNSDAFVAAWLPGTEAGGIVDVLYALDGSDFSGRLSYSWPAAQCDTAVNRVATHIPGYIAPEFEQDSVVGHTPLFPYGYGLSYAEPSESLGPLMLDSRDYGCGLDAPSTDIATSPLEVYGRNSGGEFVLRISGAANGWAGIQVSGQNDTEQGNVSTSPINYQGQYDGVHVQFDGENLAQIYLQYEDELGQDNTQYLNADSTLQFDVRVQQSPTDAFNLAQHCVHPCLGEISFQSFMPEPSDQWSTLKVPLSCMADEGMSFAAMSTPFLFFTGGAAEFDLGNVRIVPRSVDPAEDAFSCADLAGLEAAELMEEASSIFGNETWGADIEVFTARTGSDWSPVPELVTITAVGNGVDTEINVEYASDLEQTDKGVVIVNSTLQNISAYVANGTLEFELYVEDYADNVSGMVVKMESSTTGPDILIGGPDVYPAGQWHSVSINVADLGLDEEQLKEIIKPFVILPAWTDSQLGVKFSFRNVVLKLNP